MKHNAIFQYILLNFVCSYYKFIREFIIYFRMAPIKKKALKNGDQAILNQSKIIRRKKNQKDL